MRFVSPLNPISRIVNTIPKPLRKEIKRKATRIFENTVEKVSPNAAYSVRKVNEKVENVEQTVENFFDANNPSQVVNRVIFESNQFVMGDHLYVQRFGYTHHAIYIGNQQVIHYLRNQGIVKAFLEEFANGAKIHIKSSPKDYSNSEIVKRAFSRLGEGEYNLFNNNCENFVQWCRNGR